MTRNSAHILRFGSLTLSAGDGFTGDGSFWFSVSGEDATFGNPIPVLTVLTSLLHDGSRVETVRHDNREPALTVTIHASDSDALAEGEAALFLECGRRNELAWSPPDDLGATTVMDVLTSSLEFLFDDLSELRAERTFRLNLTALPFGRSDTEITVAGVAAGAGSTVVLSDGSTTTGWSVVAPVGGVFTSTAGVLSTPMPNYPEDMIVRYTAAAAVDMSTTPYVEVDIDTKGVSGLQAVADGVDLRWIGSRELTTGFTRVTFQRSTAWTTLDIQPARSTGQDGTSLRIDQLRKTATPPMVGTTRQKFMHLPVAGSARSSGSLSVAHATSALGDTLVYTFPDDGRGFVPPLRYWRTGGSAETTDATMVSGARSSDVQCSVPLATLRPGPYLVVVRGKQPAPGTQTVTAKFAFDGNTVDGYDATVTRGGFTNTEWRIVRLGVVSVPDHDVDNTLTARVDLESSGTVELDEAWLFYLGGDAHLTQLALGSAAPSSTGASNRLWIDTPSLDRPYPSIWRGTLADRSDARSAASGLEEFGDHQFAPPGMTVLTVTTNALDAVTSFAHHPHWHSNARRID